MSKDRTYFWWLLAITLFAWGGRIAVLERTIGFTSPIDQADGLDETDYELLAYQMSRGAGYVLDDGTPTARRAPGTSLLILPAYFVAGRSLLAARLWFTLLSALNCTAIAWVVRRKCGRRSALLAAGLLAVDPGALYYALHLWSEGPYCLAVTLATGCLLRAADGACRLWSLGAGVGWGVALLLRPQIAFLAPCALLWLLWLRPSDRVVWFRELLRESLIVVAVIAPWLIRNQFVIGSPTMATLVGGHTFWGSHNDSTFGEDRYRGWWHQDLDDPTMTYPLYGSELQQDRQAWDNGFRGVRRHLRELPRLELWKLYRLITPFEETTNRAVFWAFAVAWMISVPFVVIGLVRLRRLDLPLFWWVLLHLSAVLLSTLVFYGAARFRHAVEPFLMMSAAIGLLALFRPASLSGVMTQGSEI